MTQQAAADFIKGLRKANYQNLELLARKAIATATVTRDGMSIPELSKLMARISSDAFAVGAAAVLYNAGMLDTDGERPGGIGERSRGGVAN